MIYWIITVFLLIWPALKWGLPYAVKWYKQWTPPSGTAEPKPKAQKQTDPHTTIQWNIGDAVVFDPPYPKYKVLGITADPKHAPAFDGRLFMYRVKAIGPHSVIGDFVGLVEHMDGMPYLPVLPTIPVLPTGESLPLVNILKNRSLEFRTMRDYRATEGAEVEEPTFEVQLKPGENSPQVQALLEKMNGMAAVIEDNNRKFVDMGRHFDMYGRHR